jgi:dienelactone hydrolase
MLTHALPYRADGLAMSGWLAWNETATERRPGVLVFPAAPGLGVQVKAAAERLAGLGYVALGCDLYGEGRFYDEIDEAMALLTALRTRLDGVRARARGGFDALCALPQVDTSRIAAIGYCFGGLMSLELARSGADLAAVAGFHSPLETERPQDAAAMTAMTAKILICTGSKDITAGPHAREAFGQEMDAAGVDWRMSVYGGVYHSFTNPDADGYGKPGYARYDKRAHERSWREMLALFDETISAR